MTDKERAIAIHAAEVRALGAEPLAWEELPDWVRGMWIREAQRPGPAQWPPVAAAMWREDQVASEPARRTAGAREPDEPRVYGAEEATDALGLMLTNLRVVKGLQEPYAVVAASTLWRADDIDEPAYRRRARKAGA